MKLLSIIKREIVNQIEKDRREFIIYPFGEIGNIVKFVLNECFNINEIAIIDNALSLYNSNLKKCDYLYSFKDNVENNPVIILSTLDRTVHDNVKCNIPEDHFTIIDLYNLSYPLPIVTSCGRYSYGPLTNHLLVESVGAFCSFAQGTNVVANHASECISTHPFIYMNSKNAIISEAYDRYKNEPWYVPGINPDYYLEDLKRIKIGNDVWLGENVVITNYSDIGNGVIAAAGAVITKSVPDYAIVGGVPAKIIRFRYTKDQIEALNRIKWWDWNDLEISERYEDLKKPIDEFIRKYD